MYVCMFCFLTPICFTKIRCTNTAASLQDSMPRKQKAESRLGQNINMQAY